MKVLAATAAVLIAATLVSAASAGRQDNYGGVSAAEKQRVVREVYRYWNGWEAQRMLCIIGRESGFNSRAVNWRDSNGGSHGLAQANGIWARTMGELWSQRYTIKGGVAIAHRIYRASGWRAWGGGSRSC